MLIALGAARTDLLGESAQEDEGQWGTTTNGNETLGVVRSLFPLLSIQMKCLGNFDLQHIE